MTARLLHILLSSVVAMVATTNWLDAAFSTVLLPVWIRDHGYDTTQLGLICRVSALEDSMCSSGVPLGGPSAAAAIAAFGLAPALLIAGGIYLTATLVPGSGPSGGRWTASPPLTRS
jgi:hypothetical protein